MSLQDLNNVYGNKINLADGGLGSTLEDDLHLKIAHTPLWSTRAAADEEKSELLLQAHLSFLRAGARTLLTSTYQASMDTFAREGYGRADALRILSHAVSVAARARAVFCAEHHPGVRASEIRIVLSLGTFGATVVPMQDFDGVFPPPYGPRAYVAAGTNVTAFGDDAAGEARSVEALAHFHAARLLAYAREMPEAWALLDGVAFETVPVAREVDAVRRAVTRVAWTLGEAGQTMKPWWLTAVFPGGVCSETRGPGGPHLRAGEVAARMVRGGVDEEGRALAVPSGIGVNCVDVERLGGLLDEFEEACAGVGTWPWLVMKPNGGAVAWADEVVACVDKARSQGWAGLIVGGCCKAGPDAIARLASKLVDRGH